MNVGGARSIFFGRPVEPARVDYPIENSTTKFFRVKRTISRGFNDTFAIPRDCVGIRIIGVREEVFLYEVILNLFLVYKAHTTLEKVHPNGKNTIPFFPFVFVEKQNNIL